MAVQLHPAMTHSYGSLEEPAHAFGDARAGESIQAFDPVYLTRLPGAILSQGNIIADDGTILSWGVPEVAAWRPLKAPAFLSGTYFDLTGLWSGGYAHWLLDYLPRLMGLPLIDRATTKILVSGPFPTWKARSLERAGIDLGMVHVVGDEPTRVDTLYLAGPVGSPAHCHPLAAKWLQTTYLDPDSHGGATRRLYITRRRAGSRRLTNDAEIVDTLEPLGFEVLDAETLSFDEQVEAYQHAAIVVGPHGAGLANLVFCPRGTAVVELSAPDYPQLSYEWLSSHCGLRYRSIVGVPGSAAPSSLPIGRRDFVVDSVEVVRRLAELGVTG